jgi:signal transduction histidine kinase
MGRLANSTIRTRLAWLSALSSAIALLLAGAAFFAYHLMTSRQSIARALSIQATTIGLNSESALRFDDSETAGDTLAALRADPNVLIAAIYTANGSLFASYGGGDDPAAIPAALTGSSVDAVRFEGRQLNLRHRIVRDGEFLGTVDLVYSLDDLYASATRYLVIGSAVLVVAVLGAVLIAWRAQRHLSVPIADLAGVAAAVSANNDYSLRVAATGRRDELGLLVDTFNQMLARIQARDREIELGRQQYQRLNDELEQRVARRTAELEATNKELEAFTYSVSHDLRAPLRRIDGFARLLVDEYNAALPAEAARYLSRVREGTRHMGQLVDDLLNLARLGRKELNFQTTGLSSIVEVVRKALQQDIVGRHVEWQVQPLPFVDCDPTLMEVVFTNLLSNALKYTRPRERALIEVGSQQQGGRQVIFVRDNGVGFSMKYADKLFGVFQRLHRAEDFEGTGVGLATVQRILHKHGGSIWVDAELDKGACFYFTVGTAAEHAGPAALSA